MGYESTYGGGYPDFGYTPETAPHIGHSNHLCHLAKVGEISLEQMKSLVKDPHFICKKCGRVATNEDNLCEPVTV
jgi:hypothetical protein